MEQNKIKLCKTTNLHKVDNFKFDWKHLVELGRGVNLSDKSK